MTRKSHMDKKVVDHTTTNIDDKKVIDYSRDNFTTPPTAVDNKRVVDFDRHETTTIKTEPVKKPEEIKLEKEEKQREEYNAEAESKAHPAEVSA